MRSANYGPEYARDSVAEFTDGGVSVSAATSTSAKCPLRSTPRPASWAVAANDDVQITKGGLYLVTIQVLFNFTSATGTRRAELWKNGSLWDWAEVAGNAGGNVVFKAGAYPMQLRAGDYVSVYGNQSSGSSQPLFGKVLMQRVALDARRP